MKALIGITASYTNNDGLGKLLHIGTKGQSYNVLSDEYVQAIQRSGATAIIIPRLDTDNEREEMLDKLDGIVFSGGADIDPYHYGEEKSEACGQPVPDQDEHDLALARIALKRDIPILGICRGCQLINIVLGGNLYQDLSEVGFDALCHDPDEYNRWEGKHGIKIDESSALYEIFSKDRVQVNSFHHQAVKETAPDLKVVARSEDGLAEALEGRKRKDLYLVQWHPEMMATKNSDQQRVFDYFVERVNNKSISPTKF